MILLDTDIVVDLLRNYPPAIDWFRRQSESESLAVSGFTVFELVTGCANSRELRYLDAILAEFDVLWLTAEQCADALRRYRRDRLRHGAQIIDTLIAETALSYSLAIHTFNRKHFRQVQGIRVESPYSR